MKVVEEIGAARVLSLPKFSDERGSFIKLFNRDSFLNNFEIRQTNLVENANKGTFRGLHFQSAPYEEAKFFRVVRGAIQVVFFDITAQKGYDYLLDRSETGILIPRGFATGYLVLQDNTTVIYFSDNEYQPEYEKGIHRNDERLECKWLLPITSTSEKDDKW